MKRTMLFVSILLLSACTSPFPPVEPPYVCPPDLGTTWGETDVQGCTRYVCSVGGRGGFVEAP